MLRSTVRIGTALIPVRRRLIPLALLRAPVVWVVVAAMTAMFPIVALLVAPSAGRMVRVAVLASASRVEVIKNRQKEIRAAETENLLPESVLWL